MSHAAACGLMAEKERTHRRAKRVSKARVPSLCFLDIDRPQFWQKYAALAISVLFSRALYF